MPANRTGIANLPLHYGKAPAWLFQRMVKLAREITIVTVEEYGPEEMLRRLSHPYWFQAFGCVLGFDWHSSGVTTTLCGAMKEGVKGIEQDLGLFVAGGKGAASRKTPAEVQNWGELISLDPTPLVYASRMSAKVDSAAVQDGYQLYHHNFFFTAKGSWAVVQQGMNEETKYARRYHWLSESVASFVNEPHSAVASDAMGETLNLVAAESDPARNTITEIASKEKPEVIMSYLKTIKEEQPGSLSFHAQAGNPYTPTVDSPVKPENDSKGLNQIKTLSLPAHHDLKVEDLHPDSLKKIILSTYERQPEDFETLLGLPGVGAKTLRALSLISEIVHGVPPSYRDPARYSFAHGGKDGIPYPVDRQTYDQSIELLRKAIGKTKLGLKDKQDAENRLLRLER